ncbi:multidrug ABC transporter permease [Sphaerisporangium rufum]|uniref:Multidrug ABC transporter permease n=1 Tax=Sphaerisporangium rufum TaxID=1381558 RepID=A0A919R5D0_9ACTN|nr:ABC transporter ATP-binding protein [Sphaerisporangium rufum]GII79997.1 multidrug ABC transporter permease [Sphaerisporangium rufum]
MGRHATGGPASAGHDELFGRGIRLEGGRTRHEGAGTRTGFLTMARELPALVAVTARLGREAAPGPLAAVVAAEVVAGAATAVTLLSTYHVLTPLLAGGPSAAGLLAAGPAIAVLSAAAAAASAARAAGTAAVSRLGPAIERRAYTRLLEHAAGTELAALEEPGFHDLVESARQGTRATRLVVTGAVQLLGGLTGLVAVAGVLGVLHPLLLPLLAATVVPKGWSAVRAARARFTSAKRNIELTRQLEVLSGLLTRPDVAPEVRAHGAGRFLLGHYERLSGTAEREQARLGRGEARLALAGDAVSGTAVVLTYVTLGWLLLAGTVPLAVAGTAVIAIRTAKAGLLNLVMSVNQVYEQGLFVLDWEKACREAAGRALRSGDVLLPARPVEIRADRLTFAYPGQERLALDGVDVRIRPGEIVALVGANGSGKSTLAKLLTGLYLPTSGEVRWGGVPIGRLNRQGVFDRVALMTQDFARWPTTARVNLTIGRAEQAADRDRLWWAGFESGTDAVVSGLPHGWDTLLAMQFLGGTDLSGGQWQRIGLGRAWFRNAPVLVFDEPTSALDPRAEVEVFEKVASLAAHGRTVILVTHRLASVARADRIYVLDSGRVAEHGTHDELMRAGGPYAEMYRLQAAQFDRAAAAPPDRHRPAARGRVAHRR